MMNLSNLTTLRLKNFKGTEDLTIHPEGGRISIYGDNGTGKSTVFDAYMWLLTGKDSLGNAPNYFDIKTRRDGEVIHDIDHEVEATFGDITLKKVYKENWVTKHGAGQAKLKGHTTDHFLDGVPVKAGEYEDAIADLMDAERFKMLSNPAYFPGQMHWSDRRGVLLELTGEMTDADVIGADPDLQEYPAILGDKTQDQRETMLKSTKKELATQLDNIPSRIDELNGRLYNIGDVGQARQKADELKAKKQTIEAKRSEVAAGGRLPELNVERQELNAENRAAKNDHQDKLGERLHDARQIVSDRQDGVDEIAPKAREARRNHEEAEAKTRQVEQLIDKLTDKIADIKAREPKEDTGPDVCPVCERPMEEDGHDYQKYLKEFNQQKANDLKEAQGELAQANKDHQYYKDQAGETRQAAANLQGRLRQRKQALKKAQDALAAQKQEQTPYEQTEDYQRIQKAIGEVEAKIADHKADTNDQVEALDGHIGDLEADLEDAQTTIHQADENARTHKRIAELKDQQTSYGRELEEVEHQLHVIETFKRAENRFITAKVNDQFDLVEWKLHEEQVNGGINTNMCEATMDGTPYSGGLSTGEKIRVGIDIISTLAGHYGQQVPCFVDHAESVTRLPASELQIIALVVSEADNELRIAEGLPDHRAAQEVAG